MKKETHAFEASIHLHNIAVFEVRQQRELVADAHAAVVSAAPILVLYFIDSLYGNDFPICTTLLVHVTERTSPQQVLQEIRCQGSAELTSPQALAFVHDWDFENDFSYI